jgi:hypothetical protein
MLPSARLFVTALCAAALSSATLVTVPPGEEVCLVKSVDGGNKLFGAFEVIQTAAAPLLPPIHAAGRGAWPRLSLAPGVASVSSSVTGPAGEAHWSAAAAPSGEFTVLAAPDSGGGAYSLCFRAAPGAAREVEVSFSLHEGDELYKEVARKAHVSPLESEVTQLADAVASIEDEQRTAFTREQALRELDERTRGSVVGWTALEALTVLALGLSQAWALRRFFERRTRY